MFVLFNLLFLIVILTTGCSPFSNQIISEDLVKQQQIDFEYKKGYKSGFEQGYQQAQEDIIQYLEQNADAMIALRNFQRLVSIGGMAPPQIIAIHRHSKISADGKKFYSGGTELVIRKPARFLDPNILNDILESSRQYVIGYYDNLSMAINIKNQLEKNVQKKHPNDSVSILQTQNNNKNQYVLVIKSRSGYDYSHYGFEKTTYTPPVFDKKTSKRYQKIDQTPKIEKDIKKATEVWNDKFQITSNKQSEKIDQIIESNE